MNRFVNQHSFAQVPNVEIPRSVFDRSHNYKTTFDSGYLIPIFLDEVLPGDSFKLKCSFFARLATPVHPIMDNLWLDSFFFYVPNRLVWSHWQAMNGEKEDLDSSTDYIAPTVTSPSGGFAVGSIYDYLGIPTGVANLAVNALPLRGLNLIFNEWFRDTNLVDALTVNKDDGPDSPSDYALFKRGKRHDYFTSALPWPQKGAGVELPLTGDIPVFGNGYALPLTSGNVHLAINFGADKGFYGVEQGQGTYTNDSSTLKGLFVDRENKALGIPTKTQLDDHPEYSGLIGSLQGVSAVTINSLRQAFQLQRLLERDARGGTRYTEILRSHFGVTSPDARLQRPEYLGGSSTRITINPVMQTSSTDTTSPQGNLAAYGVVSDVFHGFTKSFVEHGYVFGFVCVRADLTYQQGLNRMWSRSSRFDWYWPVLAHLGEQSILNKEIYAQGDSVVDTDGNIIDNQVFGYQERYAEYRYCPSMITGQFRSTYAQSLDTWHLSQKFENLPVLNSEFIQENPPLDRAIAVQNYPQFLFDAYFDLKCARPMPVFGVPGLVDHF